MDKREATAEEARALANPVRLQILRLCLDEALTNKQIADRLGRDPGSTLHHVRMLVETGFLAATEVRPGAKGALEKPYKATGKSWDVSVTDTEQAGAAHLAMVEAFRAELGLAGPSSVLFLTRFANRLNEASFTDLFERIAAVVDEFALRNDDDGVPMAFFLGGHTRGERPAWAAPPASGAADR
ncbi:MAG TPA: winged helix-turn-helix domain-containing protein [Acidimicrobiales bacterium]